jgi:hypothetical protein
MKKLAIVFSALFIVTTSLKAQSTDPESDYILKTYSKDKKTLVSEYMNLSSSDSVKFWPVYANYDARRHEIATTRINLINQYVNGYDQLTPDAIDKLVHSSFDINLSQDKMNTEYYGKMKKAVGVVSAAKYMQLEIYLQTMWKAIVQSNIPLIGAIDKSQH